MPAQRPNIILITTDQQRYDAMGLNRPDSPLQTPTMDSLAARGVNFTRAYSTCPVCIPARRTLLTGLHPDTHGLRGYRDGLEWDPPFTLPGLLGQAGYQTELVGKLHLYPQRKRYGFDHMVRTESPNDRWDIPVTPVNDWVDALKSAGVTQNPNNLGINGNGRLARPWDMEERYHHTSWLTDQAVDFITRKRDPSCPYFLHLSYWAPHPPLTPPQAYWDRYHGQHRYRPTFGAWTPRFDKVPRGIPDDHATGPFSEQEMVDAATGYFGLINHIDDRIRYFLTRTREYMSERAKEPLWVLFTSDHGEMLGDHHLWRKSLPYEGSAHVPFFISGFNVDIQPGCCDALVSLEDVCATALDMAGLPIPDALTPELEGKSLLPATQGQPLRTRTRLIGECQGSSSHHYIVEGPLKYIHFSATGEEQLFNLDEDPQEHHDLSANPEALPAFRTTLEGYLQRSGQTLGTCVPCAGRSPRAIWKELPE